MNQQSNPARQAGKVRTRRQLRELIAKSQRRATVYSNRIGARDGWLRGLAPRGGCEKSLPRSVRLMLGRRLCWCLPCFVAGSETCTTNPMTNWDDIVANEGPMAWRTLWRLLSDRSDVEECFQETFVSALKLSRRESVTSWSAALCRLATARGMDRLRQRYRRAGRTHDSAAATKISEGPLRETATANAGPAEQAVATELSVRLRQALLLLPERQAEVFCLYAICGWTHREIGEQMQMTENAVGVTVHRARQRLHQLLDDCK